MPVEPARKLAWKTAITAFQQHIALKLMQAHSCGPIKTAEIDAKKQTRWTNKRMKRFELSTLSLARRCSTTELHPRAGDALAFTASVLRHTKVLVVNRPRAQSLDVQFSKSQAPQSFSTSQGSGTWIDIRLYRPIPFPGSHYQIFRGNSPNRCGRHLW